MNWTGGRLSRHSNAKHSLRARQKQHFAKVQANLRNGPKKPSPLKLSFLGSAIESNTVSRHPSPDRNISCSYEGSRPMQPYRNDSHELHVPLYNNPHQESPSHGPQIKSQTDREPLVRRRQNAVPDDDLYSATPLPIKRKRQHHLSIAQPEKESLLDREQEPGLEKRRRILQKGDWVGVNVQRPLQLAFTSPDHAELVGRRRKVADNHRARYNSKMQSFVRSPFAAHNQIHLPYNQARQEMARLGMSDVRIAIGERQVPPGISSSSVTGRGREPSVHSYLFRHSQGSSPDIMLLDDDEVTRRRLRASEEGTYSTGQIYGYLPDQYNGEWNIPRRRDTENSEHEYQSSWASVSHGDDCGDRFHTARGASVKGGQPIVSSSNTSLQHPVPLSSRTSVLLRSDSAEITASVVAQVGKGNPIVPSSQAVDNEIWESWVGPVFDENSQQESENINCQRVGTRRMPISPGISQAPVFHPGGERLHIEQNSEYGNLGTGWGKSSGNDNLSQRSSQPFSTFSRATYEGGSSPMAIETPAGTRVNSRLRQTNNAAQPIKPTRESDLDNIWRNFVFGSSGDEMEAVESSHQQPNPYPYNQQYGGSSTSSMLAVPSTGYL